jgi:hypothetical protein
MAAQASGLRSSARAMANTVHGSLRLVNMRCRRQKPARLPYSNMLSAPRSRPMTEAVEPSVKPVSEAGSPSGTAYSPPSS